MRSLIPWRAKNFFAYRFPLATAFLLNRGLPGQQLGDGLWLKDEWDDARWDWPYKNRLILSLTTPTDRMVDLGTGTGSILRFLQKQGYSRLAAVDSGQYAVQRLREIGIEARHAVLPEIPFEDSSFDFVIASQVLEHIVRRRRFLREIRRVLAPDGRAAIFVPDWCLSPLDEPTHVAVYNSRTLTKLLKQYFQVLKVESIRDENHAANVLFALVSQRR